jgi:hypothetical protein
VGTAIVATRDSRTGGTRQKRPTVALNSLEAATQTDNISRLYHAYVRGEAYLAAGQASAATEFQKILDHSGIMWNCWTGALADFGSSSGKRLAVENIAGRANADAARVRAIVAYKDFLTLWKDADPDIPILKQAKLEYAKLQ